MVQAFCDRWPPITIAISAAILLAGCDFVDPGAGSSAETPAATASASSTLSPVEQARAALAVRDGVAAQKHIREALLSNPDDIAALRLAAEIATVNQDADQATELLLRATRIDGFEDASWVDRTVISMSSMGKLYEAIDLLNEVLERFPARFKSRRMLFDLLINVEEHHRALPHGKRLVRERHFDRRLLFAIATNEMQDAEAKAMLALSQRNPDDPRLKLAAVRAKFDFELWEGEIEPTLLEILEHSPENAPAQYLLGRYYVETEQFEKLGQWVERVTPGAEETWQHWSILGDWAFQRGDFVGAARAYWESTRRSLDVAEVLTKLARTMEYLKSNPDQAGDIQIDPATIKAVEDRAALQSRFMLDKERLYKLGYRPNAIVADISRSLAKLGRYWEAEAWVATAMTMPDEDIELVKSVRADIISHLRNDLPWQVIAGHPVTELDLSHFSKPTVEDLVRSEPHSAQPRIVASVRPELKNEAIARGLNIPQGSDIAKAGMIPIYAQMESGGCAIDYDLDGWPDLYVGSAGGSPSKQDSKPNHFLRNLNGVFVDVTRETSTGDEGFAQGVTFGDVNEDGFHDVLVMNYGRDRVFINQGDGTFSDGEAWLADTNSIRWSTCVGVADLDSDGISDLVRTHYCAGMDAVEIRCFDTVTGNEGPCLPTRIAADVDTFCQGKPEGGFKDVTDVWQANPVQPGRGLGLVIGSLDQSKGLDVLVANDMTNNHYWSGGKDDRGQFRLVESGMLRGLAFDGRFRPQACMGIAVGDLNDDGDVDFFVTNFELEHNTLFEQTKPGFWSDQTDMVGLRETSLILLGFGTQAIDFDNDSYDEIAITNGHVRKDNDPPATYAQRMQILYRQSGSKFDEFQFNSSDGYLGQEHVGRGMWVLDANRDGKNDLAITHQTEPLALLINKTPTDGRFVRVKLVGVRATRDPIGAIVRVTCGDTTRMKPLVTGDGFFCANERTLHFGLGDQVTGNENITIEVTWPDQTIQSFAGKLDQEHLIVQGEADAFVLR